MAEPQIDVEHLFTLSAQIGDNTHAVVRGGPHGTRYIAPVVGGEFEGPRIKGTVVAPGGDWVSMRPGGVMRLDVRLQLVTDDGESILMQYQGISSPSEGGNTLRTAPLFEASAEGNYAWLNNVQAIGIGETGDGSVTYEIYALK